nr:prepilin-type N-terminal cleavage/methylation domain-containing protein [uncultured Rhodoferax sp.]
MTRPPQRGFTLIELIIFIVVVGAGLAGILSVMNQVVRNSADPMLTKQAAALADSVLEEVLQKAYADPDGTNVGETGRSDWDNVDDFNGATQAAFGLPPNLAGYTLLVAVSDGTATLGIAARRVVVTATIAATGVSVVLTGYRADY